MSACSSTIVPVSDVRCTVFEGDDIRKTQEQAVQDELHANYEPNARSLVQPEEEIPVRKRNTITDSVI